jgi:hypothetical protein
VTLSFDSSFAVLLASTLAGAGCGGADDTESSDATSDSDTTSTSTESSGDGDSGDGDSGDGDGSTGDGDGTTGDGDGTTGDGDGDVTSFRISTMSIRDPHFFVDAPPCNDLAAVIDLLIGQALQMDADDPPDDLLDLSLNLNFWPLDQAGSGGNFVLATSECAPPYDAATCSLGGGTAVATTYSNVTTGDCLVPDPAHLSPAGYSPLPNTTSAPCFTADAASVNLDIGGIVLSLTDTTITAQYDADPATQLVSGVLKGFLTQADAEATILPTSLPMPLGGVSVASLMAGGQGNCAAHSDMDTHDGAQGWWFYADFEALPATWN